MVAVRHCGCSSLPPDSYLLCPRDQHNHTVVLRRLATLRLGTTGATRSRLGRAGSTDDLRRSPVRALQRQCSVRTCGL